MTKKKISLIQAIVQLLTMVSLFIPISFIRYFHNFKTGISNNFQESLFEAADTSASLLWGVALIIFSLVALVYYILHFVTDMPQLQHKYCIAISSVPVAFLIACLISINNYTASSNGTYGSYSLISQVYGVDWGFYLICALYLSLIVLELFKHFYKFEEIKPKTAHTTILQNTSPIEEVKQFKELLDAGIITQEEFDAKKKQLLGL